MSVKPKKPPPVVNRQYQDKWNTNQNWMKNTPPFYIVFQVLKVLLCKTSHQIFYLLFYISFYISRHQYSQICRTSFNIIWKKRFLSNFPFLMDSLNPPHTNTHTHTHTHTHPNGQNLLSVTKVNFLKNIFQGFWLQLQ